MKAGKQTEQCDRREEETQREIPCCIMFYTPFPVVVKVCHGLHLHFAEACLGVCFKKLLMLVIGQWKSTTQMLRAVWYSEMG